MGRTARDNRNVFHLKPVERIEVNEQHVKLRFVIVIVLAIIGIGLLAYTAFSHLATLSGWEEITPSSSAEMNCSGEFAFQYQFGKSNISPSAEKKALVLAYTNATVKGYRIFNATQAFPDVNNVFYLNHHPNEDVVVDEALYRAFAEIADVGNRNIYLAPIYGQYDNLFFSQNDAEAVNFDPYVNEELASWYAEIAAYAKDSESVDVKLLGNNTVRLQVSEDYLEYAKDNYVDNFIDFYWMKNAFLVDFLADSLKEQGFVFGSISSYDGFCRNLDPSEESFVFELYNRHDNIVDHVGSMNYSGEMSIVSLRDYPMNSLDFQHYYEAEDGRISFPYVDVEDGFDRCSMHNLVAYSRETSCSRILLDVIPFFIGDEPVEDISEYKNSNWDIIKFENGVASGPHDDITITTER